MATTVALSGYRRLLRARAVAFAGDTLALTKSREALRGSFNESRNETDPDKIAELLRGVDQAEEMLRFHILQGKQNERGNFSVKIDSEKAERMASHEQLTHIDEEQIPLEEKPLVSTHKPPNK